MSAGQEDQGDGWFAEARRLLDDAVAAVARYGAEPDPELRLVRSDGLVPWYDPATRTIALGRPDAAAPDGRLARLVAARLWGAATVDEAVASYAVQLPLMVAHELGHHLRHRYGAPQDDAFVEEQAANALAVAIVHEQPARRADVPELARLAARTAAALEAGTSAATAHVEGRQARARVGPAGARRRGGPRR